MSSLRRDLLERRLWPVVALLLVAIVAVPLFLRKDASADTTPLPPAPPGAATAAPTTRAATAVRVRALEVSMPRDPFASGMPRLRPQPESKAKAADNSPASSTSTTATTAASMVSPSPVASTPGSSATTPTTPTTPPAQTQTTPTTPTTGPSAPPAPATDRTWTTYSVAVRFGTGSFAPLRSDLARLTPLPSVAQPKIMFMGVMAGGRQAVFALGAGVQVAGPAACSPDSKRCAAVVLRVGQSEQFIAPTAGGPLQLNLSLASITGTVTHSRQTALTAYQRHSAAGLCELDLADPVLYSQGAGTLSPVANTACKDQPAAVPFPGALPGS